MLNLKLKKKKLKKRNLQRYFKWNWRYLSPSWQACIPLVVIIFLVWNCAALAQDTSSEQMMSELKVGLDTMWLVIASILVIFMNAGFAMLETGLCRRKNAVNILTKNLIVFAIATFAFWAIGFALMFGDGNSIFGGSGFFLSGLDNSPATGDAYQGVYSALNWTGTPLAAKFLFQVAFAGTAATIVSGAVAERIKFVDFLLFSFLLVSISYSLIGHWIWGGGWLSDLGFKDFAGSSVVHSVGGWSALTGTMILGPRLEKYKANNQPVGLPGHNMSIATLGCLILWVGWFGFNSGSAMGVSPHIAHIALVTNLSAALGGITATLYSWFLFGKPDLSMTINGILAGLVAMTASCAFVSYSSAVLIGGIAGLLVVQSILFFEKIKIDDPVGAISVHLINGIWGTLAVGLWANPDTYGSSLNNPPLPGLFISGNFGQIGIQIIGILAVGVTIFSLSWIFWLMLKAMLGLRVSPEEELKGLDLGEHDMEAYPDFPGDISN